MFINLTCPCTALFSACSISVTSSITACKNVYAHFKAELNCHVLKGDLQAPRFSRWTAFLSCLTAGGLDGWLLPFRNMGLHPWSCSLLYRCITCPIRLWVNGQVSCLLAVFSVKRKNACSFSKSIFWTPLLKAQLPTMTLQGLPVYQSQKPIWRRTLGMTIKPSSRLLKALFPASGNRGLMFTPLKSTHSTPLDLMGNP